MALGAAAVGGVILLLAVIVLVTQDVGQSADPPPTSIPTTSRPLVAVVNGEPIERDTWLEAVLMDQVMSRLAGVAAPTPRETLDRLLNATLLLQALPGHETPSAEEVEATIATLESSWGLEDGQVVAALQAVGLERASLEQAVVEMIVIQRVQAALEAEGTPVLDWLEQQRAQADIVTYQEHVDAAAGLPAQVAQAVATALPPTPTTPPTPAPSPTADLALTVAPDFTLEQAGGGSLTLSEQLAQGPVVLVFFQRCG
jgi:hypothetical protein